MDTWRLDILPDDVLFIIFDYCDLSDFTQLDLVCKRFHYIIHSNAYWNRRYRKLLVTNQVSEQFRKRCNLLLPPYSKYFISQNWVRGSYQKWHMKVYEEYEEDGSTLNLQLTSDKVWWNGDYNSIVGCDRHKTAHETNICSSALTVSVNFYITTFILWRDYIVTGDDDGSIIWQAEPADENKYNEHKECILKKKLIIYNRSISALDATSNIIFSASGSEYTIIRVENSLDIDSISNDNIVRKEIPLHNIQSLAIHPLGTILSVVSEDKFSVPDRILHFDLENDFEMRITPRYQGTVDVIWEDPNTLLMCSSYEIQKYDFRINDYVSEWHNSLERGISCISSDHHNTMITGTDHCKAVLWDQRMSNFVQMYSMDDYEWSPRINSLRFDSTKLYCATDHFLYELDFSKRGRSGYKLNLLLDQMEENFFIIEHCLN